MPYSTKIPELPAELMREIADRCSLPTLVNLQLASKNWAAACRGVGKKFRDEPIGHMRENARSEIEGFADDHVYTRRSGDSFYFGLRGVVPPVETLAGGEGYCPPPEPATPAEIDAYVLRRWESARDTFERRLFERAAESILRPYFGAAAAGIVVPAYATASIRIWVFGSDIGANAELRVRTAAGAADIEVDVDRDATLADIEEMLWKGPRASSEAARLFKRRSERILAARRSSIDIVCSVDVRTLLARGRPRR